MQNKRVCSIWIMLAAAGLLFLCPPEMQGQNAREVRGVRGEGEGENDSYAAVRLFKRAEELLEAGERERAVKMFETIVDQYVEHPIRFKAYLALGRHHMGAREYAKVHEYLRNLHQLNKPDEILAGETRDMYLEALCLMGEAHFHARQYNAAFSILRQITTNYPNTLWANQAYYFIGMSHFAQEHWDKAIRALSLVGTFADPDSPAVDYVEAGHRLFVRILDKDLPVLQAMNREISVLLEVKSGDREKLVCGPLPGRDAIFTGSMATEVGVAKRNNGKLEIIGGDVITVRYADENTKDGKKNVAKERQIRVVSSASLDFTMGTYESKAPAAFLEQPLFVRLHDVDLDVSPQRDTVSVRVVSLFKVEEEDEESGTAALTVDISKILNAEEKKDLWQVRDEVMLALSEQGSDPPPVHSGIFTGSVRVGRHNEGQAIDKSDQILDCVLGDDVLVSYVDEIHSGGNVAVEISSRLQVSGEIDSLPRAAQDVVVDPVIRARKEIVEAEAYLELARIFKSMGLTKGAAAKADEALDRLDFTIKTAAMIPPSIRQKAFELKWDAELAKDDFGAAMATCRMFNKLYPESPAVDRALMGIGKVFVEKGEYAEARKVFSQVLHMPNSLAKAEAQFLIAEMTEKGSGAAQRESAVAEYKLCASRYPDSPFAGAALGKIVDYHIDVKNYAVADDLLEQIFTDYQDESFLDRMLLRWVMVAYRMGNYQKAHEKCSQLIFEYPGSAYAEKAKELLGTIESKLKGGGQ